MTDGSRIIFSTSMYEIETQRVGTVLRRKSDGQTVYFQPGEDEKIFLSSVLRNVDEFNSVYDDTRHADIANIILSEYF